MAQVLAAQLPLRGLMRSSGSIARQRGRHADQFKALPSASTWRRSTQSTRPLHRVVVHRRPSSCQPVSSAIPRRIPFQTQPVPSAKVRRSCSVHSLFICFPHHLRTQHSHTLCAISSFPHHFGKRSAHYTANSSAIPLQRSCPAGRQIKNGIMPPCFSDIIPLHRTVYQQNAQIFDKVFYISVKLLEHLPCFRPGFCAAVHARTPPACGLASAASVEARRRRARSSCRPACPGCSGGLQRPDPASRTWG